MVGNQRQFLAVILPRPIRGLMVGIAAVNLEPLFPEIGKRRLHPLVAGFVQIFVSVRGVVPGNFIFHVNPEQGQADRQVF